MSGLLIFGNQRIAVDDRTEPSELAALLGNWQVTLDVTNLDPGRLPEHVTATLYTEAAEFSVPQLRTSRGIDAPSATSFSAPQLQTSKNINACHATSFSVPQLQTAGHIYASSAPNFSAPQLRTAGCIDASSATSFSAPQLQTSMGIAAEIATIFDAPPDHRCCYTNIARRPTIVQRVRKMLRL